MSEENNPTPDNPTPDNPTPDNPTPDNSEIGKTPENKPANNQTQTPPLNTGKTHRVIGPDGLVYDVTPEEYYYLANEGFKAFVAAQTGTGNTDPTPNTSGKSNNTSSDDEGDDEEDRVARLEQKFDTFLNEQRESKRKEQARQSQQRITTEINSVVESDENIKENEELRNMVTELAFNRIYKNPSKSPKQITEEVITSITGGKAKSNEEYINGKRQTAENTRTAPKGTSSAAVASKGGSGENGEFTAKDLKSGKLVTRTRQRLQELRNSIQ